MRIGIFTNSYHPAIHGVVRSIDIFRGALSALGHEVYVFCPADETFEDNDPAVFRYPSLVDYAAMDCRIPVPHSFTMSKVIKSLHLDIIHSQHPIYIGYEAARQAKRCDIPMVFTYHSQYDAVLRTYINWPEPIFQRVIRRFHWSYLGLCDCAITPTESIRKLVAEKIPIYASLLHVQPTPLDLRLYQGRNPQPIRRRYQLDGMMTFVTTTRLAPEKNLKTELDAFATAAATRPNMRLLIIGDGPYRKQIEHHIKLLNLSQQVILTGMVPMEQVPEYLAAADAYICASLTETQGLGLLEGMAAGLPAAAIDAPGSSDAIIHEHNGLLVGNSTADLAAAIGRLADDSQLRARLGQNALRSMARYEPAAAAQNLVALYQQTIAKGKAAVNPASVAALAQERETAL